MVCPNAVVINFVVTTEKSLATMLFDTTVEEEDEAIEASSFSITEISDG